MEDAKLESRTLLLPNGRTGKEICVGVTKDHLSKIHFTIRQSFYDYGAGYEDKAEFILAKATAIEFRDLLGWFIAQNEQLEQCSHEQRKRVFDDALLSRTVSAKDEEFSFQFKHNSLGSYLRIHEKNESKTKRKVYQKYITSRSISSQKYITVPSDGMEMFRDVLTELTDKYCSPNEPKQSSLSAEQRARAENNRLAALERKRERENKRLERESANALGKRRRVPVSGEAITLINESDTLENYGEKLVDSGAGYLITQGTSKLKRPKKIVDDFVQDEEICNDCGHMFGNSFLRDKFNYDVCDECNKDDKYPLMTLSEVKSEYLLSDNHLKRDPPLKFLLKKNPHHSGWGEMKLFLMKQVEGEFPEIGNDFLLFFIWCSVGVDSLGKLGKAGGRKRRPRDEKGGTQAKGV